MRKAVIIEIETELKEVYPILSDDTIRELLLTLSRMFFVASDYVRQVEREKKVIRL